MRVDIVEGYEVCHFLYDEDMALADSVMSVLSNRGAGYELNAVADDLYFAGTHGHIVKNDMVERFMELLLKLVKRYEKHDKADMAPPLFSPEDNGLCQRAPTATRTGELVDYHEWYVVEQMRAWREVWEDHRKALSSIDDCYLVFPGDDAARQQQIDRELTQFFRDVISTMAQYKMTYYQVIADVYDRSPHAGLDRDELMEVKGKYWDEAKKWIDKNRKNTRKMSPKMAALKARVDEHIKRSNPVSICDGGSDKKTAPLKSRLSEVEARKAYDKELADYQEYLNRGKMR